MNEPSVMIVGIGSEHRNDDAAGLAVARALRNLDLPSFVTIREIDGPGTELLDLWSGVSIVHLIDAVSAGADPGAMFTLDLHQVRLPRTWNLSSHGVGIPEAVELGQILDNIPPTLILHAIQGQSVEAGQVISPPVRSSIRKVAALIELEVLSVLMHESPTIRLDG